MRSVIPMLFVGVIACAGASSRPSTTTSIVTAIRDTAPTSLLWSRSSAEHRAAFVQTYRSATTQLELRSVGLTTGSWAVALDADETVLDNSIYQQERARHGLGYSNDSWSEWVKRVAASALPGAVAFTARVHQLGGLVVIVTNRNEAVCTETRANLRKVSVDADVVLCAAPGQGDKNPRFRAIETGSAAPGIGPLRVVMWVGDNIQDFPGLHQDVRFAPDSAFAEFGRSYFLLPNPMYGSWEKNPLP
jgi:5'-nucleotidase (lipoprotein e(P4) family)